MLYCFRGRLGHLVIPIWITCAKATSRRRGRRYLCEILFHLNRYASTTGCQPTRPQLKFGDQGGDALRSSLLSTPAQVAFCNIPYICWRYQLTRYYKLCIC